nr:hypothetical protein CFP56_33853 [Quercus suber]
MALWYQPPPPSTLNRISPTLKLNSLLRRKNQLRSFLQLRRNHRNRCYENARNLTGGTFSLSLQKGLPLAKPRASASTIGIKNQKSLEANAVVSKFSDMVQAQINNLLAN